jgi:hypothetical protein
MKILRIKQSPLIVFVIVLMTAGSMLALAAEPENVAPINNGKADPADATETQVGRSSTNNLKVNQAELEENGGLSFDTNSAAPQLKPMTMEINAVLEQSRLQVATLQDRFDNEPNAEAAVAIVRQIEQLKINTELDILRVQVRYARTAGNVELAQQIEASLTQMTTPAPRREPVDRPAPAAGNR